MQCSGKFSVHTTTSASPVDSVNNLYFNATQFLWYTFLQLVALHQKCFKPGENCKRGTAGTPPYTALPAAWRELQSAGGYRTVPNPSHRVPVECMLPSPWCCCSELRCHAAEAHGMRHADHCCALLLVHLAAMQATCCAPCCLPWLPFRACTA